jgi:hypothetical protein
MRPITLNLATRPFRNNIIAASVLGVAAALVAGLAVFNLYALFSHGGSYAQVQAQERDNRARLEALAREERSLMKEIAARDFKGVYDRGRFANDLILRRSFSWTLLFNRLESVIPPEVMMSAIRPSISGEGIVIRVEGVARTQTSFLELQDALLKDASFTNVYPLTQRRLNPSRPETTFALNFDYRPPQAAAPEPPVVAADAPATAPGAPPPTPGPAAPTAAGTPPSPAAPASPAIAAHPNRSEEPGTALASVAAGSVPATSVLGTVGRDGRPRGAATPARIVAVPGGVSLPPGMAIPRAEPGGDDGRATAADPPVRDGTAPARRQPPAAPQPGIPASAGAPPGASREPASAAGTAQAAARVPPLRPAKTGNLPRPQGRDPRKESEAAAAEAARVFPAVRLDVPLAFEGRPVREVYDALARAHGVTFALDGAVDGSARVTLDLGGRPLPEAIRLVSVVAGHRVERRGDGTYRVAAASGGAAIGDRPVAEETIPPVEVGP